MPKSGVLVKRRKPPKLAADADALAASLGKSKQHREIVRRNQESKSEAIADTLERELKGLVLLCEHYKIAESDPTTKFLLLSLALAREYVPYFQPPQYAKPAKMQVWLPILAAVVDEFKRRGKPAKIAYEIFAGHLGVSEIETWERELKKWRGKQKKRFPTETP